MSGEILVNATAYETRVALVEHGLAQEVQIERPRRRGLVGNIYRGRVVRLMPGMQAAFVDIGAERTAFLHAGDIVPLPYVEPEANGVVGADDPVRDIQALLAEGDTLLVQVVKDPIGTKGARLSARISLPARHMVLIPGGDGIGVSARIEDEAERERLTRLVEDARPAVPGLRYIVRTAGEGADDEALTADMRYLVQLWRALEAAAAQASPASLVHEDLPLALRVMRDRLEDDVARIRVDFPPLHQRMKRFAETFFPELAGRVELYDGERPIFDLYGVEDEIARALERRVNLKSGGYLVFDQTEAMATIDVNTGACLGGAGLDETALKTNLEAARVIARQLRLRNLGGIVTIDFIDMTKPAHRELLLATLKRELAGDHARTAVTAVSPLGLVEMTRKRTRDSLERTLTQTCTACAGRGVVKTPESVCFDVYRELARLAGLFAADEYLVLAPPAVVDLLLDEESDNLAELSAQLGHPLKLQVESQYRPEQFDVIPL
ncbi:MAG: Rne/Rng family ribonuclease [Gammaproteobacteria bacterium]